MRFKFGEEVIGVWGALNVRAWFSLNAIERISGIGRVSMDLDACRLPLARVVHRRGSASMLRARGQTERDLKHDWARMEWLKCGLCDPPLHSGAAGCLRRFTFRLNCAGLAIVLLLAFAAVGHAAEPGWRIYATNESSGDLTVIDGGSGRVAATLPLGKRPRGIGAAPDGRWLYVALSGSPLASPGVDESTLPQPDRAADGIAVVDTATGKVDHVIRAISDPEQVAVDGVRGQLFVAGEDTGQAVIVDLLSGRVLARRDVGGQPEGVAVSPHGPIAAVTSEADGTVALIDTRTHRILARLRVGERPRDAAFTPDGSLLLVTGELDDSLVVVDVAARKVARRLAVPGEGALPKGVAIAANGRHAYVTIGRGGRLVELDLGTWKFTRSVKVGQRPWGVALSPDGRYAYTANGPSNDVSVVDTTTFEVVATVPVGKRPWGVAVVPGAWSPADVP